MMWEIPRLRIIFKGSFSVASSYHFVHKGYIVLFVFGVSCEAPFQLVESSFRCFPVRRKFSFILTEWQRHLVVMVCCEVHSSFHILKKSSVFLRQCFAVPFTLREVSFKHLGNCKGTDDFLVMDLLNKASCWSFLDADFFNCNLKTFRTNDRVFYFLFAV